MSLEENPIISEVDNVEQNPSALNSVTPFSKYLAMILFILMPFLGGWIGYKYSPAKVVEIDKVVIQEVKDKEKDLVQESYDDVLNIETYKNPNGKFTFEYPSGWLLREDLENDEWVSVTPLNPLPDATEAVDISIKVRPLEDFYESAVKYGYLTTGFDEPSGCKSVVVRGITSARCESTVVEGVTFIIPLPGDSAYKEAVYIRDSIMSEFGLYVINSFKVESETGIGLNTTKTSDKYASWETYKNSAYGFEFQYPPNSIIESRLDLNYLSIRLQNYSSTEDRKGLGDGEYYLEIHIYDKKMGHKASYTCSKSSESIVSTQQVDLGGVVGYRGRSSGDGGHVLCAEYSGVDFFIRGTEKDEKVPLVNLIFGSFKFIN